MGSILISFLAIVIPVSMTLAAPVCELKKMTTADLMNEINRRLSQGTKFTEVTCAEKQSNEGYSSYSTGETVAAGLKFTTYNVQNGTSTEKIIDFFVWGLQDYPEVNKRTLLRSLSNCNSQLAPKITEMLINNPNAVCFRGFCRFFVKFYT